MLSNLSERQVYNRLAMYSGSMEIILKEVRIDKCNEDQGKDHKEERKIAFGYYWQKSERIQSRLMIGIDGKGRSCGGQESKQLIK